MDRLQTSASDLAELLRSGILPVLLDVRDRAPWSIELVDGSLTALLGPRSGLGGPARPRFGRNVADLTAPSLRAAAIECMRALEPTFVQLGQITVSCSPVRGGRRAAGVVLVATETGTGSPEIDRARMSRLGSWVAGSLEAQLASPSVGDGKESELRRLSSLLKILKRVSARGSARQIVRSVIEAISVWHDIEAWGYRRTLRGTYRLEASLPGSMREGTPSELDRDALASPDASAAGDANRAGWTSPSGVRIVPVRTVSAPEWCLVFQGTEDARLEAALAVYCDLLAPALDEAAAVESLRLTWAIVEHILPDPGPHSFESAARQAVGEVSRATHGDAWLTVSASDRGHVVTIGSPQAHAQEENGSLEEISVTLDTGPLCKAMLGVRARVGFELTQREMNLLRVAGETLSPWIKAATGHPSLASERRVVSRSFDQLIERQARNAATRRDDVSVIVIALGERARSPDVAQEWIGEIRRRIRPTDLTGRLASGDIGILLLETPPRRAHFVAHRIQRLIGSGEGFNSLPDAGVGVAGWSGTGPAGSVVSEASKRAAADGGNG